MSEYIDRQALLDAIPTTEEDKQISLYGAIADFIIKVNTIPAADVVPVVHGHWIENRSEYYELCYSSGQTPEQTEYLTESDVACSSCLRKFNITDNSFTYECANYCPNCGAKMDENEVENLERCSCGDRQYCPEVEKDENGKWLIRCHMCHRIVWGDTIEEAADKWNERADTNDP